MRLEHQNDVLEKRSNDKDREVQELRSRNADFATDNKKLTRENLKTGEELTRREEKLQSTVSTLKDAQALLKNADAKIDSQRKEINTDKQSISDLKQMNQDLKNKFEGLLSLRRRTERDCALHEGRALERQKANDDLTFDKSNLARKLEEANERNDQLKRTIQKLVEELDGLSAHEDKGKSHQSQNDATDKARTALKSIDGARQNSATQVKIRSQGQH